MQTIKTVDRNIEMLCESVFEKHINLFIQRLKELNLNVRDVLSTMHIAFDKIDASKVKVYDYVDEDVIRKVKSIMTTDDKKNNMVFALKDGQIWLVFSPYLKSILWLPATKDKKLGTGEAKRSNPFYDYEPRKDKDSYKMFEHADEIWIVNFKNPKINTSSKEIERKEALKGLWTNTPEFYAKVLQENLKRYKLLITQLRIKQGDQFETLVKKVNELVQKISEYMLEVSKNINTWGSNYEINYAIRELRSYANRLFSELSDLIEYQRRMKEAEERGESWCSPEYYSNYYNNSLKDLKDYIEQTEKSFKAIDEKIKEWKEEHK